MIHGAIYQAFAGAGSESGVIANQSLNGLVVSKNGDWHASDYLTVVLKSKNHAPKVLCNRLPLEAIAGISGLRGGQDRNLQASLNGLTTTDYIGYSARLPLGCLKMQENDSSLEVTLEAGEAKTYSVCSYFDDDDVDHMIQWLLSEQLTETLHDVESLYVFNATEVVDPSSEDLSVMIQGPDVNSIARAMDIFGYSASALDSAAECPQNVAMIYKAADPLHGNVTYQITGTTTGYKVISSHVLRDAERVSRGTIGTVGKIIRRARTMPPSATRALRRSGILPAKGGLEASLSKMNVKG